MSTRVAARLKYKVRLEILPSSRQQFSIDADGDKKIYSNRDDFSQFQRRNARLVLHGEQSESREKAQWNEKIIENDGEGLDP
ncbi:hypothetical protein TNCV_336611 [Trichonephila clavipes]|nr:hypothetical protein TNCV_336611 [Trichonephila clavipes]